MRLSHISLLTHKVSGIVVRLDGHPNVLKVTIDVVHLAKVGGAALVQQQQLIEHVKHLRRRLMHAYHNCLLLQLRVPLEYVHQRYGRVAVQPRGGFLQERKENIDKWV